ncbi:hypothetical protein [Rhodoferax sp.]|uniref:hypothetical protein n=1 Tax=Rhodoferax sp. TaxID=50421 RepID=UPI002635B8F3|nr:hypothetical protein [Rhodoferax sp.]MDD3938016.1 hypothetical protein [Rhodoferax sp.]
MYWSVMDKSNGQERLVDRADWLCGRRPASQGTQCDCMVQTGRRSGKRCQRQGSHYLMDGMTLVCHAHWQLLRNNGGEPNLRPLAWRNPANWQ